MRNETSVPAAAAGDGTTRVAIRVWDLPLRLFHWALTAAVIVAFVTGKAGWLEWHLPAALSVLALLLFRLFWGILGSESARFTRFLRGPLAVGRHLTDLVRRRPDEDATHNPLGGWAAVVILLVLAFQAGCGLLARDDDSRIAGPLAGYVPDAVVKLATSLHEANSKVVLIVLVLHIVAIGIYARLFGRDLVRPMLSGIKFLPAGTAAPRLRGSWLALALFLLCAAAVRGIATLGG